MDKLILKADKRKIVGRKVKILRKEGLLPCNVFGKKIKSLALQVKLADFVDTFKKAGETGIVYLNERPVLISNIQKSPVSGLPIHVDFHQIDLKEKVEADVPVEVVGESPVEKQSLGTVVQYIDEVSVEALPMDLPEKFEIDAATLIEVDQAVYVKDLKVDRAKVEIKLDADTILVKVEPPQKEEVAPVVETPEAEVVSGEEGKTNGPEPVEGEKPAKEGEEASQTP
ncbi:MAG: 50S ribosomal protein L25 [bacterium]|nr:50S ribosomal protein L25 [bacterium]